MKNLENDTSLAVDKELEEALNEVKEIEKEYKDGTRKGYNNVNEMLISILED